MNLMYGGNVGLSGSKPFLSLVVVGLVQGHTTSSIVLTRVLDSGHGMIAWYLRIPYLLV